MIDRSENIKKSIAEVRKEFSNKSFDTAEQRTVTANHYKVALLEAGMSENDVENELDGWLEVNWTQEDWKDHYGVDSEDDLDDVLDWD